EKDPKGERWQQVQQDVPAGKRIYSGLDLMRLFCMLLIVILHVLGHGGVLASTTTDAGYRAAWLLEAFAYVAVDCFALMSGFLGYHDKPRPLHISSFISLWLEVVFYGVLAVGLCWLFDRPDLTRISAISALLPVTSYEYWFFTAYAVMFFLSPAINHLVRSGSERLVKAGVLGCVAGLSLLGTLGMYDPFRLAEGYSAIWLCTCYYLGASIKRLNTADKVRSSWCAAAIAVLTLVTWAWYLVADQSLTDWFGRVWGADVLMSYRSPTVLLASCAWLLLMVRLEVPPRLARVLRFFAPAAFGVYLIHDNPLVRGMLMSDAFAWIGGLPAPLLVLAVLGCACAVFAVCLVADRLRVALFSAIRIPRLADACERGVRRVLGLEPRR
ncbi:MAG: acyltransferase, partial [Coriobacteriales bacterium]|nr:acyltransferase [Coriobacteriales bacterium]